ncbi:DUF2510 domain-containing protein [Actinoplanes sp. GCM10030250]|uniref:DUF2510 domain-containing protein n=1 Tax=Actinoplanes sp. GCM10030250 TaxID=3273376 RepID=UPI00360AC37E
MSPAQPPAPPGWYADPSGLPASRWWDGQEWTSHVQPGATARPPTTISAGWRGGPATKPVGEPLPGAHTVEAPGDQFAPTAPPSATLGATQSASSGYAQSTTFLAQPMDAVSAQLGYTSPAPVVTPPAAAAVPSKRAVVVGAVSLLVNPLLLCSVYAILMGLRGIKESPAARRDGLLAVGLGAGGVLTHAALVAVLILVL